MEGRVRLNKNIFFFSFGKDFGERLSSYRIIYRG